jgi:hypothetical protein
MGMPCPTHHEFVLDGVGDCERCEWLRILALRQVEYERNHTSPTWFSSKGLSTSGPEKRSDYGARGWAGIETYRTLIPIGSSESSDGAEPLQQMPCVQAAQDAPQHAGKDTP